MSYFWSWSFFSESEDKGVRGHEYIIEEDNGRQDEGSLTLQVSDDEVVVELDRSVLLHLILQFEDGLLHVRDLGVLFLQLRALLSQHPLLLRQLFLHLILEHLEIRLQLQGVKDTREERLRNLLSHVLMIINI